MRLPASKEPFRIRNPEEPLRELPRINTRLRNFHGSRFEKVAGRSVLPASDCVWRGGHVLQLICAFE